MKMAAACTRCNGPWIVLPSGTSHTISAYFKEQLHNSTSFPFPIFMFSTKSSLTSICTFTSTPANLRSRQNTPEPSTWDEPDALFAGSGYDFDTHFANMNLVLNVDFCGAWAGSEAWDSTCSAVGTLTCEEYVDQNPGAYADAYGESELTQYVCIFSITSSQGYTMLMLLNTSPLDCLLHSASWHYNRVDS